MTNTLITYSRLTFCPSLLLHLLLLAPRMHARRVPSRRHGGAANASPSAGHVNFPTTLQVSPRNLDSMSLGAGLLATVAVSALGYYLRDKFPEGLGFRRRVQRALNNIYANPIPFDEGGNDPRAVNTELQRYMQAHVRLQQNPDSVLDPYGEERIEGLANIGNTCYMNSLIQALCSMTGFGEYLRSGLLCFLLFIHRHPVFPSSSSLFFVSFSWSPQRVAEFTSAIGFRAAHGAVLPRSRHGSTGVPQHHRAIYRSVRWIRSTGM